MSLNGLRKKQKLDDDQAKIDEFINGAKQRNLRQSKRSLNYLRQTFSLTQQVSDDIDSLVVKCAVARANRSLIVKVALQQLSLLSAQELQQIVLNTIEKEV